MSSKFSPLSAAVAAATAGVILTVAGCAMGTRSSENTEVAGLSRDADTSPTLAQATPTNPLDDSATNPGIASSADMPGTTTASSYPATTPMPADTASTTSASSGAWNGAQATSPGGMQGDTAPASAAATPPSTSTSTPTYPDSSAQPSSASDNTTAGGTASSNGSYGADQPLPPRSDRN